MLQKAKTPAGMLAFPGSGVILPNQYYKLGVTFCQEKKMGELAGKRAEESNGRGGNQATGRLAGKRSNPAAFRPKAPARGAQTKVRKMW